MTIAHPAQKPVWVATYQFRLFMHKDWRSTSKMGFFNKTKQHPKTDTYAEQVLFEALNDGCMSSLNGPKEGKQ